MKRFEKNGDFLKYVAEHGGNLAFGNCSIKIGAESIEKNMSRFEKYGINGDTIESYLIDCVFREILKLIFSDKLHKRIDTDFGYTDSISEHIDRIGVTTAEKLQAIEKFLI